MRKTHHSAIHDTGTEQVILFSYRRRVIAAECIFSMMRKNIHNMRNDGYMDIYIIGYRKRHALTVPVFVIYFEDNGLSIAAFIPKAASLFRSATAVFIFRKRNFLEFAAAIMLVQLHTH
jgi:hypothetical protein